MKYFVVNYNINELEQIKNDIEFSKEMFIDYNKDIDGQRNSGKLETSGNNDKEILFDLDNELWN